MKSLCPSRVCNGTNPLQTLLIQRDAEGVHEEAMAGAIICSNCGCVRVRKPNGQQHILGRLRRAGGSLT